MLNSSIQPILVTLAPPSNGRREKYSIKQAITLGVVQVILGVTCFGCQIAAMVNGDIFLTVSRPAYGEMMVAGGLGISAAKIVAVMVMSILASVSSFIIFVFSGMSLGSRDASWDYHYNPEFSVTRKDCVVRRCPQGYTTDPCTSNRDTRCEIRVSMSSILVLCGVAELVVAIWASALCCTTTCCGSTHPARTQGVVYHGPSSQCQITSTGGRITIPAIRNVQYATPGQVVVFQQPAPIGNASLPNYAQAAVQPQAVLNCAQAAVYNQPAPAYSEDAGQPPFGYQASIHRMQ